MLITVINPLRYVSRLTRLIIGTVGVFALFGCGFLGLDATSTPGGPLTATVTSTSTVTVTSTAVETLASATVPSTATTAPTATIVPTTAPTATTVPTIATATAISAASSTASPQATQQANTADQLSITVGAGTQDIKVEADGTAVILGTVPSAIITIHFPITLSGPVQVKVVQPSTITWTVEGQTQIDPSTVRVTLHAPANAANGSFTVQVTTSGYTALHFLIQVGS